MLFRQPCKGDFEKHAKKYKKGQRNPLNISRIDQNPIFIFSRLYQVEDKMNKFYLMLVKESLNNEDVAKLAKDNVRDCHEIEQAFKASNGCYTSYFYRTLLEILGSIALAVMFSFYSRSNGIGIQQFDCAVYDALFLCIVPNSKFFLYVYIMSLCLIGGYLMCSVYNFMWIVHPRVGILSAFLDGCQRQKDSYTSSKEDKEEEKALAIKARESKTPIGPKIRLNLYFKVRKYKKILLRKRKNWAKTN